MVYLDGLLSHQARPKPLQITQRRRTRSSSTSSNKSIIYLFSTRPHPQKSTPAFARHNQPSPIKSTFGVRLPPCPRSQSRLKRLQPYLPPPDSPDTLVSILKRPAFLINNSTEADIETMSQLSVLTTTSAGSKSSSLQESSTPASAVVDIDEHDHESVIDESEFVTMAMAMASTPAEKLEQMEEKFKAFQRAILGVVALVGILVSLLSFLPQSRSRVILTGLHADAPVAPSKPNKRKRADSVLIPTPASTPFSHTDSPWFDLYDSNGCPPHLRGHSNSISDASLATQSSGEGSTHSAPEAGQPRRVLGLPKLRRMSIHLPKIKVIIPAVHIPVPHINFPAIVAPIPRVLQRSFKEKRVSDIDEDFEAEQAARIAQEEQDREEKAQKWNAEKEKAMEKILWMAKTPANVIKGVPRSRLPRRMAEEQALIDAAGLRLVEKTISQGPSISEIVEQPPVVAERPSRYPVTEAHVMLASAQGILEPSSSTKSNRSRFNQEGPRGIEEITHRRFSLSTPRLFASSGHSSDSSDIELVTPIGEESEDEEEQNRMFTKPGLDEVGFREILGAFEASGVPFSVSPMVAQTGMKPYPPRLAPTPIQPRPGLQVPTSPTEFQEVPLTPLINQSFTSAEEKPAAVRSQSSRSILSLLKIQKAPKQKQKEMGHEFMSNYGPERGLSKCGETHVVERQSSMVIKSVPEFPARFIVEKKKAKKVLKADVMKTRPGYDWSNHGQVEGDLLAMMYFPGIPQPSPKSKRYNVERPESESMSRSSSSSGESTDNGRPASIASRWSKRSRPSSILSHFSGSNSGSDAESSRSAARSMAASRRLVDGPHEMQEDRGHAFQMKQERRRWRAERERLHKERMAKKQRKAERLTKIKSWTGLNAIEKLRETRANSA